MIKTKKYSIQVYYKTGDSFSSRDATDTLEVTWDKLSVAKENLKRIEEHYKWFEEQESTYRRNKPKSQIEEPARHKKIKSDFGMERYIITLKTDAGKDFQFHAFWCGYFETLYSAEITFSDNDLRVNFR